MARARECVDEARLLLDNARYNATANRREYAKTGLLPKAAGRALQRLFDARIEGDYRDLVTIERARAESLLGEAEGFVREVGEFVEREISRYPPAR